MNRRTQILALFLILFLSVTTFIYWSLDDGNPLDDNNDDDDDTDPQVEIDLSSNFEIDDLTVYRGENYQGLLEIETDGNVTIQEVKLTLNDTYHQRQGIQNITINETFISGIWEIPIQITPAFPFGRGAVISVINEPYNLIEYEVVFNTSLTSSISNELSYQLMIEEPPVYDQSQDFQWNITQGESAVTANKGEITISAPDDTDFSLSTMINGTGYPRINVQETKTWFLDPIEYRMNNSLVLESDDTILLNETMPIGNYFDMQNFTISGTLSGGETITINLALVTKSVTLFAVIADSYFSAESGENFEFREPDFYVEQMSYQFERVFNVSIIPSVTVEMPKPRNSTLLVFAQDTISIVGRELGLNQTGWEVGTGSFEENDGYDILLIFTNRTMDNLGVVYGNQGGAFNLAIHARGSQNTGNYRLPPSFADNLIQHEVSHVFGAPDRFTATSPPSIMSKSTVEDALNDLIFGDFWLYLVNWLEADIQTMIETTYELYW